MACIKKGFAWLGGAAKKRKQKKIEEKGDKKYRTRKSNGFCKECLDRMRI
jgi:hypothetical protein